jgi:bifunctional DNA-binding transcriptional regulator/antitoxin component of YhaV-PrlF toxin-antitoxin module
MSKTIKRKLTRVGGARSISVVIPVSIVKDLKWKGKQKVEVKRVSRGVMISDAKTKHRKK